MYQRAGDVGIGFVEFSRIACTRAGFVPRPAARPPPGFLCRLRDGFGERSATASFWRNGCFSFSWP